MSAIISSVSIAIISWILFQYFQYIPVPVISAILINIAIGMLDIKTYKKVYYYDPKSFWILLTVGIITFVEDPMIGIAFGTGLSLLLYLRHASQGKVYGTLFRDRYFDSKMALEDYVHHQKADDVFICKFSGEINFVCITAEIEQLVKVHKHVTIILSFSNISYIDIDGLETFEEVVELFEDQ
jgi:SulP family sulfate permease